MRFDASESETRQSIDARLVGAGVLLLLAAGLAFVPTGVGFEVSAGLVAVAFGGLAFAVARTLTAGR